MIGSSLKETGMKKVSIASILLAGVALFVGCASLVMPDSDRTAILKMRAEIIPQAEFRDAHIWAIVEFYNTAHLDDDEPIDPATQTILVLPMPVRDKLPRVTFRAHQLSLYESMRTMARLTGLEFRITDGRPWLIYEE